MPPSIRPLPCSAIHVFFSDLLRLLLFRWWLSKTYMLSTTPHQEWLQISCWDLLYVAADSLLREERLWAACSQMFINCNKPCSWIRYVKNMVACTSWLESSNEIAENSLLLTTLQDESLTLSVTLPLLLLVLIVASCYSFSSYVFCPILIYYEFLVIQLLYQPL